MVDTAKAEQEVYKEKLEAESKRASDLEAKLAEYQKKEEDAKKAEEEAAQKQKEEEERTAQQRLADLEKAREEDKKAFEEKLAEMSERKSNGQMRDPDNKLTREEYEKNKEKYDTMVLKESGILD